MDISSAIDAVDTQDKLAETQWRPHEKQKATAFVLAASAVTIFSPASWWFTLPAITTGLRYLRERHKKTGWCSEGLMDILGGGYTLHYTPRYSLSKTPGRYARGVVVCAALNFAAIPYVQEGIETVNLEGKIVSQAAEQLRNVPNITTWKFNDKGVPYIIEAKDRTVVAVTNTKPGLGPLQEECFYVQYRREQSLVLKGWRAATDRIFVHLWPSMSANAPQKINQQICNYSLAQNQP